MLYLKYIYPLLVYKGGIIWAKLVEKTVKGGY